MDEFFWRVKKKEMNKKIKNIILMSKEFEE
jgi:hypothetical protein